MSWRAHAWKIGGSECVYIHCIFGVDESQAKIKVAGGEILMWGYIQCRNRGKNRYVHITKDGK